MWGTWKPAARKSVGKVIIEALKPHQFRTNVHDEVIIDKTPLENPESFCCRVIYLADQWPELQRLIDAAVDVSCRYYCRGGRGRVAEDVWDRHGCYVKTQHYQSSLSNSASFEPWETENTYRGGARNNHMPEYGGAKESLAEGNPRVSSTVNPSLSVCCRIRMRVRSQATILWDERYTTVGRLNLLEISRAGIGGIRVCKLERLASRDHGVSSHGMGAEPSRRAASPVLRVGAKSMETDALVSYTACNTPNKGLDIATSELWPLSTAEIIVTSAVSAPALVEGTMAAVEGAEDAKCHGAEDSLSILSKRVPNLVDGKATKNNT